RRFSQRHSRPSDPLSTWHPEGPAILPAIYTADIGSRVIKAGASRRRLRSGARFAPLRSSPTSAPEPARTRSDHLPTEPSPTVGEQLEPIVVGEVLKVLQVQRRQRKTKHQAARRDPRVVVRTR